MLIHMLWGVGIGLYASLATLLIYRIFFFAIGPDDLTPLLWVVMGAAANQHQCRIDSPTHRQWHAVPALDAPIHRRCDARLMGMLLGGFRCCCSLGSGSTAYAVRP